MKFLDSVTQLSCADVENTDVLHIPAGGVFRFD